MFRIVRKLVLVLLGAAISAAGLLIFLSPDPLYSAQELTALGRYSDYDDLIVALANKHGVDIALVKATVWRESAFHSDKVGTSGERGLMQVGEAAATEWARATFSLPRPRQGPEPAANALSRRALGRRYRTTLARLHWRAEETRATKSDGKNVLVTS